MSTLFRICRPTQNKALCVFVANLQCHYWTNSWCSVSSCSCPPEEPACDDVIGSARPMLLRDATMNDATMMMQQCCKPWPIHRDTSRGRSTGTQAVVDPPGHKPWSIHRDTSRGRSTGTQAVADPPGHKPWSIHRDTSRGRSTGTQAVGVVDPPGRKPRSIGSLRRNIRFQ